MNIFFGVREPITENPEPRTVFVVRQIINYQLSTINYQFSLIPLTL